MIFKQAVSESNGGVTAAANVEGLPRVMGPVVRRVVMVKPINIAGPIDDKKKKKKKKDLAKFLF